MFPLHFYYHISVLSCFRYVPVTYFFLFFCSRDQCNVSEILPLRTIKVNKGKFTLEIAPLLGSLLHALVTLHVKTVRSARLPLLSILSDKNRREY